MKLLFITVIFTSIRNALSVTDKGKYFILDNLPKEAYLFSTDDCTKTYICKSRKQTYWFFGHEIYDCYYRTETVDGSFGPSSREDPNQCSYKGYITIDGPCYYTSNCGDITIGKLDSYSARVYDIDNNYNRELTAYGWCSFAYKDDDANWMTKISNETRINQINIPGTHDSGTYAMDEVYEVFSSFFRMIWGKTQNLDIYEQLFKGIRYLDVGLETNEEKEIYLTHEKFDCYNKKTGEKYYLSDVFDEVIDFLHIYSNETVIIHMKNDNANIHNEDKDIYIYEEEKTTSNNPEKIKIPTNEQDMGNYEYYKRIADLSINNDKKKYDKLYKDYFYNGTDIFPSLGEVRGKIILFTRNDFIYKENDKKMQVGLKVSVPEMGDCDKEKWLDKPSVSVPNDGMIKIKKDADKHEICYPRTTNHTFSISSTLMSDYKILVQDDYNLLKKEKWAVINDLLNNDIPIATEIRNDTDYYLDIYGKDNKFTTKFYNDGDVLTINFMNMQAVWKIGRTIKGFAEYINNNLLSNVLNKSLHIHNKWMVMDFPSTEIIRKVRDSTD